MKTIQQKIQDILENNMLPQLGHAYHLQHSSLIQLGDESSTEVLVYREHFHKTEEHDDQFEQINALLMRIEPDEHLHDPEKILDRGLHVIWVSEKDDSLQIQLSDHSIHFIIHYSGQY
mgnify:CR=1 FL=1